MTTKPIPAKTSKPSLGATSSSRATRLEDLYKVLKPSPLLTEREFAAFYRPAINDLRGTDIVGRLSLALERCHNAMPLKALLMGHSGVGKSTELTRLIRNNSAKYRVLRLSVTTLLDPQSFAPFDVLLLMMAELAEATARPVTEGGAGKHPSDAILRDIWDWFSTEKETMARSVQTGAEAAAGAGVSGDSWWAKALGLFASLKGEFKYASVREKQVTTYRLSRLDSLIQAVNKMSVECDRLLRDATGCEWLFAVEDCDKAGVSPKSVEDFFVTYANVLRDLEAHWIFTIPIALGYSPKASSLPAQQDMIFCMPDTMVFHPDNSPHLEGRAAVQEVLEARLDATLFAPRQLNRLIVASGGNLRDLFAMTCTAGDEALLRHSRQIEARDVDAAVAQMRTTYERRLGEGPYDVELWAGGTEGLITFEKKAQRLVRIYKQDPAARIPDPVLFSLLHARAVREFNGNRWFGIHPLVVDILAMQGKIKAPRKGPVPGGPE